MMSEKLIEKLGLQLVPGGFCQWGPTLLASDLLLGGPHPKGVTDQSLLSSLSIALRNNQCSRLVILGRLFAKAADPAEDLPGLLVAWRSELLEAEIIWVFPEPFPAWSGILDFLEVKPAPSGSMLGEVELISTPKLLAASRMPAFIGGASPKQGEANGRTCLLGWASEDSLILPSIGGKPKPASTSAEVNFVAVLWPHDSVTEGGV